MPDEEEDFGAVDMATYTPEQEESVDDFETGVIDMSGYSESQEAKEADWWDTTKDWLVQGGRGIAQAFTWPLDVGKAFLMGEALSDLDELEDAMQKAGKPFDRDEYRRFVMQQGEYFPTQGMLEDVITEKTGFSFEPQTESGKRVEQFSNIASLAKGRLPRKLISGAIAAGSTEALKQAGVPETPARLVGDLTGGIGGAVRSKAPRQFSPEVERLKDIADKHGIPFYEFMTREGEGGWLTPKISAEREAAISKELGISSKEAAKRIIEGKLPISQARASGADLRQMEADAYAAVDQIAASKTNPITTSDMIKDIKDEVSRIRKSAPSLSHDQQAYIKILEEEAEQLAKSPNITAEQLVNQHKNYNSNVKGLYRKPQFSGTEEATRDAYAFLNSSVRNTMEKHGGKDLADAFKGANKIFHERAVLKRSEALLEKAFDNGQYNPTKLKKLLDSKQGQILRRDLGEDAIKELREIAEYGELATKKTDQLLRSQKYAGTVKSWGKLAPFLLLTGSKTTGAMAFTKNLAERMKGRLLTNPASREVTKGILKSVANGSLTAVKADFDKLEELISGEYGSVDAFVRDVMEDHDVYEGDFD